MNFQNRTIYNPGLLVALTALLSLVAIPALASVPVSITQQGRLLDNNGDPRTGSQDLEFTIYDSASGGEILWSDSVSATLDEYGVYSVKLGDSDQPIDAGLLQDGEAFLALSVDSSEFSPRLEMTAVPFAALAQRASTADAVTDGAITSSSFAPGALSWSDISDIPTSITDAEDTLSGLECGASEVAIYDGTSWNCGALPSFSGTDFATADQSCSAGQVASGIAADGTLQCVAQQDTTYSAGTGLNLAGGSFQLNTTYTDGRYVNLTGNTMTGTLTAPRLNSTGDIYVRLNTGANTEGDSNLYFNGTSDRIYRQRSCFTIINNTFCNDRFRMSNSLTVEGAATIQNNLTVGGNLTVNGDTKNFAHPHREDPAKQITYVSLEGGESGTYWRGSSQTQAGEVTIELPEHFRLTTSSQGLTATVTPRGQWAPLFVKEVTPTRVVVAVDPSFGDRDVDFDILVQGVRDGFENFEAIGPNIHFNPLAGVIDEEGLRQLMRNNPHVDRRLTESGLVNPDGSINYELLPQASIGR